MVDAVPLLQSFSREVMLDTLTRALSHIASLSEGLDVRALAETQLDERPGFVFQPQNDFGLLAKELVIKARDAAQGDMPATTRYQTLSEDYFFLDATLTEHAFSIAGILTTAHAMLRDQIPGEVVEISTRIEEALSDRLAQNPLTLPTMVIQSWGRLMDEAYRQRVYQAGRARARVFEENRPIRLYYATSVLAAAEQLVTDTLPVSLTAEATELLRPLLDGVSAEDGRFWFNVLFRSYGVRNLVASARVALENGAEIHAALQRIAVLDALLEKLSILCTDAACAQELSHWLMRQITILEEAVLLINGAFYTLAMTSYLNTLVLTHSADVVVVNGFCFPAFLKDGGTPEDIRAFGFYLQRHALPTSHTGWSVARTLELSKVAVDELTTLSADTKRHLQADNSRLFRLQVERVVQSWMAARDVAPWRKTPDTVMASALTRLLTRITQPEVALADLLTDYLVEIRGNRLLSQMKMALYTRFSRLIETSAPDTRRPALVSALLDVAIMMLSVYTDVVA